MSAHVETPNDPPELSGAQSGFRPGMSTRQVKALVATLAMLVGVVLCLAFTGLPAGGMGGGCGGG